MARSQHQVSKATHAALVSILSFVSSALACVGGDPATGSPSTPSTPDASAEGGDPAGDDGSEPDGAATHPIGDAKLVETRSGDVSFPRVAVDAQGNGVAVWQRTEAGAEVWANVYTRATSSWGEAILVSNGSGAAVSSISVAMSSSGKAIAVWAQGAGATETWANRYEPGSGWTGPVRIDVSDSDGASPSATIDVQGNAIVVWGDANVLSARRFVAGAATWDTPVQINTGGQPAGPSSVGVAQSGNAVATWRGGAGEIWATAYTSGGAWSTPVAIDSGDGAATLPALVMSASGVGVAVWGQATSGGSKVFANEYAPGTGWSGANEIGACDDVSVAGTRPRVAINTSGDALAVWQLDNDVQYARLSAGSWKPAAPVADTGFEVVSPVIGIDDSGEGLATWTWKSKLTARARPAVSILGPSGWGAPHDLDTGASDVALFPDVAVNGSGQGLVVWTEGDVGMGSNVWSRAYP